MENRLAHQNNYSYRHEVRILAAVTQETHGIVLSTPPPFTEILVLNILVCNIFNTDVVLLEKFRT